MGVKFKVKKIGNQVELTETIPAKDIITKLNLQDLKAKKRAIEKGKEAEERHVAKLLNALAQRDADILEIQEMIDLAISLGVVDEPVSA